MTTTVEIGAPGWQQTHLDLYLRTDGAEGHFVDFSKVGGPKNAPCLILKTTGRKSGQPQLIPLIYGVDGDRFVVVASKGGAPKNPAWYLNLDADPKVEFQVVDRKYAGVATTVEGDERQRLFDMMAKVYSPYIEYQAKTDRVIPVIVLTPTGAVDKL